MPRRMKPATDVHLPLSLLVKVATALGHFGDFFAPGGNGNDMRAGCALLGDEEVRGWLEQMRKDKLVPRSRSSLPNLVGPPARSNYTRG